MKNETQITTIMLFQENNYAHRAIKSLQTCALLE